MSAHRQSTGNTGQHPWQDPYALASESGTEDNVEDHVHFAGDAQVRPIMRSSYPTTRTGAHQINRPATSHPHEPLMYSPRSTQRPSPYTTLSPPPQQQEQQHSQRLPTSARPDSTRRPLDTGATPGLHPLYGSENGIGMGVMLSSSQEEEEEDAFHASILSLPQEPYGMLHAAHAARSPVVRPTPAPSTTIPLPPIKQQHKPPLPEYQPLEPTTPSPRRSKRYLDHSPRIPDIAPGTLPSTTNIPRGLQQHLVSCEACRTTMISTKNSVLVKCPKCRHVSSATPLRMTTSAGVLYG